MLLRLPQTGDPSASTSQMQGMWVYYTSLAYLLHFTGDEGHQNRVVAALGSEL